MTKKVCILVLIFYYLIFSQVHAFQLIKHAAVDPKEVPVCFVDFRIGLVVGKSETDISNEQYCIYTIDHKKFISLLTPVSASVFYMNSNVRAKISLSAKEAYFIDYNGVVRFGDKKFQIDKKAFTRALQNFKGYRFSK